MGRYIQATARKTFSCAWKCTICGTINTEFPQAEAFAREDITLFKKEDKARALASEKAEKNLSELFEKIPTFVNLNLNYNQLMKCGTCTKCKAVQPWARKPPFSIILGVLTIAACIALAVLFPEQIKFVVLGGIFAFLAALGIGEAINTSIRRGAGRKLQDEHCRPLAITNSIPDYVKRDDPRLLAILTVLAQRKQA